MDRYVLWFAGLGRFYQVILAFALLVGLVALAVSAATDSVVFLVVGACWLAGGSALVWLADRRERR